MPPGAVTLLNAWRGNREFDLNRRLFDSTADPLWQAITRRSMALERSLRQALLFLCLLTGQLDDEWEMVAQAQPRFAGQHFG